MGYAALVLATIGFAVGLRFRVTALLPIVMLLLLISILFSVLRSFSVLQTALVIVLAQAIMQYGYCLGAVARAALTTCDRALRIKKHAPRCRQI
jgi:hypothetical protein